MKRLISSVLIGICSMLGMNSCSAKRRKRMELKVYDKYVKIDGRWWIEEREQHFVYTSVPPLA